MRKHGGGKRRVLRKGQFAIDEATTEVRAVELTGSGVIGAPTLLTCCRRSSRASLARPVSADRAYDRAKDFDQWTAEPQVRIAVT